MIRILCLTSAIVALAALSASAQSDAPAPKHMTVIFENSQVRVLRAKLGPGDKSEPHELRDAVSIPLTDYEIKFTAPDGSSHGGQRKVGEPAWLPASSRVSEVGDKPAEAIIVELKCGSKTSDQPK